jgi:hypothetical protein
MKPEPHLTPKISGPTHLYILTNHKVHNLPTYVHTYVAALWWKLNCFTDSWGKKLSSSGTVFRNALSWHISNHKSWTVSQTNHIFCFPLKRPSFHSFWRALAIPTLHFQNRASSLLGSSLAEEWRTFRGKKFKIFFSQFVLKILTKSCGPADWIQFC